jgi:hypothetical protein
MDASNIHLSAGIEDGQPRTPLVSLVLAYAAMLPIAVGAAACVVIGFPGARLVVRATLIWAGSVLCFLAGVRRGLSFRQERGPTLSQLGTMLWLFVLGVASLLMPWRVPAAVLQLVGYATMALYDPQAAEDGEVPRYFARLRPIQMIIPVVSLAILVMRLAI